MRNNFIDYTNMQLLKQLLHWNSLYALKEEKKIYELEKPKYN